MKVLISVFTVLFAVASFGQMTPAKSSKKIQIAILFDTSNSMDGLIEQAKATIWQIVNAASKLTIDNEVPTLEIALYDYGNSGITDRPNYIRKQCDLISDLDSISGLLFGLRTNGGSEYCAAVIESAVAELKWSTDPQDMRLIYISGNEMFNQGPVNYLTTLPTAANKGFFINTIYCGPYDHGVTELWYDAAQKAQGNYFNIDASKAVAHINTPYDKEIQQYNDSLNSTYMGYGSSGYYRAEKQKAEDRNAYGKGEAVASERAMAKSKAAYKNSEWDVVDAVEEKKLNLDSLKKDELPLELRDKTKEEQEKIIQEKAEKRKSYQEKINTLAKDRETYITEERKKQADANKEQNLGSTIIQSMNKSAETKGYKVVE
ncbi:MAG: hypothetical protein ACOVO3_09930 [Fluviicola sp.]|jgi:hypothetical protein